MAVALSYGIARAKEVKKISKMLSIEQVTLDIPPNVKTLTLKRAFCMPIISLWAKDNGYLQMDSKSFVGELRRHCIVRQTGREGNFVDSRALAREVSPYRDDTGEKLPWD